MVFRFQERKISSFELHYALGEFQYSYENQDRKKSEAKSRATKSSNIHVPTNFLWQLCAKTSVVILKFSLIVFRL